MQINPQKIKKQFEKSLAKYNENAIIQKIMAEKLVNNLPQNYYPSILELGCGTGILTKELAQKIKFDRYIANDLLIKAKKYTNIIIPNSEFIVGNAQKISVGSCVDLVISNAMFQWIKRLDTAIEHFKTFLNPEGILAFSTFSPENFREIKDVTGLSLEYKTKNELCEILQPHFEIISIEEFEKTLKFNTPLELLAHMKNTGVNSLERESWTFKEVKSFCDKFSQKYPQNNLTYSPIIIVAKRK